MKSEPIELNQTDIPDIEQIGKALYGEVWVAQLARQLKNKHGDPLPQSSLKSMRDRNNLPDYIKDQLAEIFDNRINEIKTVKARFNTELKIKHKLLELRFFGDGDIYKMVVEKIKFVEDEEVYSLIEKFMKKVNREGLIDISEATNTTLTKGHYEDKHFFFQINQLIYR
ncbi:hypothetical protein V6380_13970 [Acinetobacter variabilis]|uniref:hypothetical protein n=1 Tax=Acinetobacter variabilis TaxID=70346 RepID=UPI003B8428B6